MSAVTVAILPKPALSPADYQRLAYRLTTAMTVLRAREDHQCGPSAIDDLIAGEAPKSVVMRTMSLYRDLKKTFKERFHGLPLSDVTDAAKKALAGHPLADLCDVPAVYINLPRHEDESNDALSARIQATLPQELISEVRSLAASTRR